MHNYQGEELKVIEKLKVQDLSQKSTCVKKKVEKSTNMITIKALTFVIQFYFYNSQCWMQS